MRGKELKYTRRDIVRGVFIYASGDTVAALMLNEFSWWRMLGLALVGASFYAFEIPNYFSWIERKVKPYSGFKLSMVKTGLAMLYFNPLWIARHLFFIRLFSGTAGSVSWDLLRIASISFGVNIPISLIANYIIQNKINLKYRFLASAIFSALMAIYYAASVTLFK
ncbi:MAG: hypothetical protein PF541_09070 [Prolixibacteraceae bacterium]|jgi:hypothetical protein|nr:hypothetical protein [Prolixibacteraceae bacterium]